MSPPSVLLPVRHAGREPHRQENGESGIAEACERHVAEGLRRVEVGLAPRVVSWGGGTRFTCEFRGPSLCLSLCVSHCGCAVLPKGRVDLTSWPASLFQLERRPG